MMRLALRTLGIVSLLSFATTTLPAQLVFKTVSPFLANNGGSSGGAIMFDLDVISGVQITDLVANCSAVTGTGVGIEIWEAAKTYVGNENNVGAWTMIGQDDGTAVSAGRDGRTTMHLAAPVILTPGVRGIMLIGVNTGHSYTNGNGANQSFSDAFLKLSAGSATNVPHTGGVFNPRVWNGEIHYLPSGTAASVPFGAGCAGSNGTPGMAATAGSAPVLGSNFSMDITNLPLPSATVFILIGFSDKKMSNGLTLPFDLGIIGAPKCQILVDPLATGATAGVSGTGTYVIQIPQNPTLKGVPVYFQSMTIDPAANALGFTTSNAIAAWLGL